MDVVGGEGRGLQAPYPSSAPAIAKCTRTQPHSTIRHVSSRRRIHTQQARTSIMVAGRIWTEQARCIADRGANLRGGAVLEQGRRRGWLVGDPEDWKGTAKVSGRPASQPRSAAGPLVLVRGRPRAGLPGAALRVILTTKREELQQHTPRQSSARHAARGAAQRTPLVPHEPKDHVAPGTRTACISPALCTGTPRFAGGEGGRVNLSGPMSICVTSSSQHPAPESADRNKIKTDGHATRIDRSKA